MSRRYIVALVVAFFAAASASAFWFARHDAPLDGEFSELEDEAPATP